MSSYADLKYGLRLMRRSPGFSLIVVLTLALGIGAATAVFSVVYGVLIRPLPYRDPGQLVLIEMARSLDGANQPVPVTFPLADLPEWQARARTFDSIAFYTSGTSAVSYGGATEMLDTATVSDSFFATLHGRFAQGRGMDRIDEQAAVVVSGRLSRRLFGDLQGALGRQLTVSGRSYQVIGVADPTLQFPNPRIDVWLPASDAACCPYSAIARLRADVDPSAALADFNAMLPALTESNPRIYDGARVQVMGIVEHLVGESRLALWILMTSVGLVLLVVCANVANLLVVRNASRARELAVRIALGASRGGLTRQSLIESAIAVTMGGGLGILIALGVIRGLAWLGPAGLPRLDDVRIDLPVLAFAVAVAAATTVVVGVLPAVRFRDAGNTVQLTGSGRISGPNRRKLRYGLVIAQLALSMVLLVSAALLGRSLVELMTTDLGVQADRVATASMNLSFGRRLTAAQQMSIVDRILTRIRSLPQVVDAGVGGSLPPNASNVRVTLKRQGGTVDYQATAVPATPGYFSTLGMRLSKGRLFTESDDQYRQQVVIMTEDTARRFFGEEDPIGRTVTLPLLRDGVTSALEMTLVGIVSNVKYSGLDKPPDDAVYRPLAQQPWGSLFLVAKAKDDPAVLASMLRAEIAAIDPGTVLSSVTTLDAIVSGEAARPRFRAALLITLAALTLGIASVGLYGVVSQTVSQRTAEIAVRMALGADVWNVLALVFREVVVLAGVGIAIGLIGALAATRLLTTLLFGIEPTDPTSFVAASLVMLLVAAAAAYVPARRAAGLDPSVALRAD
jgi:predicted permease